MLLRMMHVDRAALPPRFGAQLGGAVLLIASNVRLGRLSPGNDGETEPDRINYVLNPSRTNEGL